MNFSFPLTSVYLNEVVRYEASGLKSVYSLSVHGIDSLPSSSSGWQDIRLTAIAINRTILIGLLKFITCYSKFA
jgi:hypothetical protein